MDEETPRSHKGPSSSPRSEADSTRAIPGEQRSRPALLSFEQSRLARDRNHPRLYASQEIDPRTVPRYVPSSPADFLHQLPSSNEERTEPNYRHFPGPTSRPSSDEEETQRPFSLFLGETLPPSSSGSYQVVRAGTSSTTFSSSTRLPSNAREVRQPPTGTDSDTQPSEVPSESTQSKAKDTSGSTSAVIFTSSSPSRAEALHSRGKVDAGAGRDSKSSEDKAEAPQHGSHDDGPSSSLVPLQHGSGSDGGKVPLNQDVLSQQATQIEGPSESKLADSTRKSRS